VVRCDLHPEKTGRLEVFERAGEPSALFAGPGSPQGAPSGHVPGSVGHAVEDASIHAPGIASHTHGGVEAGYVAGNANHEPGGASHQVPTSVEHLPGGGGTSGFARRNASSLAWKDPLSQALSRDLGTVGHSGSSSVFVEATYAPPEYISRILGGGPVDVPPMEPDTYVAVVLTEAVHAGTLPGPAEPPELYVSDSRLPLVDSKVTTELPHHRETFYRFARTQAFGTGDQVLMLRLASGQEATWHVASPNGGARLVVGTGVGASLALVGWLLWASARGRARRSPPTNRGTPGRGGLEPV
jgi:hypothetical protein